MQRMAKANNADSWASFSLVGKLPPVKLNKVDSNMLERRKIINNYLKLTKPKSNKLSKPRNDEEVKELFEYEDDLPDESVEIPSSISSVYPLVAPSAIEGS